MVLNFKRQVLGINFNFGIEARLPRQEIYNLRLKLKWGTEREFNHQTSKIFIWYALKYLPEDSFIIFYFAGSKDYFVQFCRLDGSIVLDIPLWSGNQYYGQEKESLQFLRDMHFQRKHSGKEISGLGQDQFDIDHQSKDKKSIRANFGKIYIRAAAGTLLIGEDIFGLRNPAISYYESGRLTGMH